MHDTDWVEVWRFETRNLAVVAEIAPEDMDPADSFEFTEDIDAVRSGAVEWFQARVFVAEKVTGAVLGSDYLGGCAYKDPADLLRSHTRTRAGLKRVYRRGDHAQAERILQELRDRSSSTINPPVRYGYYGPGMVREACREARAALAKLRSIPVREVA